MLHICVPGEPRWQYCNNICIPGEPRCLYCNNICVPGEPHCQYCNNICVPGEPRCLHCNKICVPGEPRYLYCNNICVPGEPCCLYCNRGISILPSTSQEYIGRCKKEKGYYLILLRNLLLPYQQYYPRNNQRNGKYLSHIQRH